MLKKLCTALGLCLSLAACAVGNTTDYRDVVPPLGVSTANVVAVTAEDQRPYVLADSNTPQWVGMVRGGYGNPFGVHTASGQPLAIDLIQAATDSLKADGVKIAPGTDADRTLSIVVKNWKSDTWYHTSVYFDVSAEVRDKTGQSLAMNMVSEKKKFENDSLLPSVKLQQVHDYFKELMDKLLNPSIRQALN